MKTKKHGRTTAVGSRKRRASILERQRAEIARLQREAQAARQPGISPTEHAMYVVRVQRLEADLREIQEVTFKSRSKDGRRANEIATEALKSAIT